MRGWDLNRRAFLRLLGGSALALGCGERIRRFDVPGEIVNLASSRKGHVLRQPVHRADFAPARSRALDVAIVGAGVSGLSAAWKLKNAGIERLQVLEIEDRPGGTSVSGGGGGQPFPWGAHYINIPPREADCIHEVLADIGIISGYDASGRPEISPDHLVRFPRERLFTDGEWTEGIDPFHGAPSAEREQWQQFEDDMLRWTLFNGSDDRRGFAMPLAYSTADSRVRELDEMTMLDYLRSRRWDSPQLRWLIDFCCRDDYGCLAADTSAWAGIHYFACRFYDRRVADQYPSDTLTWHQGNAFLTDSLAARLQDEELRTDVAVVAIDGHADAVELACIDTATGERTMLRARCVVYAGKLHAVPFVLKNLPTAQNRAFASLRYTPWLVAAIHLRDPMPAQSLAWDNVIYESPSVGYVAAGHQRSGNADSRTLVYYLPFADDIENARRELLRREHAHWANRIMNDLTAAHPELDGSVERIDLYAWGHAMVRPEPGVIWGESGRWRRQPAGNVAFATCDVTGLPLFEEAVYCGVRAAEYSLEQLGVGFETSVGGLRRA